VSDVAAQVGLLETVPEAVEQLAVEDRTWRIDCSAKLATGQTVTDIGAILSDTYSPLAALQDAPTLVGAVVHQRVRPVAISTGGTFLLTVTFTPSGTTDIEAVVLTINCPT
jgi:hypothetical protein